MRWLTHYLVVGKLVKDDDGPDFDVGGEQLQSVICACVEIAVNVQVGDDSVDACVDGEVAQEVRQRLIKKTLHL